VLIGGGEIKAYSRFSSELESDTVLTGGFLKGPLGYTYIRQGATDHSWNVDVYNGGAFINALKIEQDGSATFARTVRIGGGTPGSASAGGTAGAVVWDASYIYVCIATDTWKRVAIATW
jgi:hypothetical protein